MQYLMTVEVAVKGHEPKREERKLWARSKNKMRQLIYVTYPYGNWFTQELFRKGRVKLYHFQGHLYVNQEIADAEMVVSYELRDLSKEKVVKNESV